MDITDIFDDAPIPKPKVEEPPAPDIISTADLRNKAKEVAEIYDDTMAKVRSYEATRKELIAKIDSDLEHRQAEADAALEKLNEAKNRLQEAMEKAKVNTITMPDRKPVKLKVILGRRLAVSKKLLKEVYGNEKADEIWIETEKKGPDKTDLVIPDPFEDEPDN